MSNRLTVYKKLTNDVDYVKIKYYRTLHKMMLDLAIQTRTCSVNDDTISENYKQFLLEAYATAYVTMPAIFLKQEIKIHKAKNLSEDNYSFKMRFSADETRNDCQKYTTEFPFDIKCIEYIQYTAPHGSQEIARSIDPSWVHSGKVLQFATISYSFERFNGYQELTFNKQIGDFFPIIIKGNMVIAPYLLNKYCCDETACDQRYKYLTTINDEQYKSFRDLASWYFLIAVGRPQDALEFQAAAEIARKDLLRVKDERSIQFLG